MKIAVIGGKNTPRAETIPKKRVPVGEYILFFTALHFRAGRQCQREAVSGIFFICPVIAAEGCADVVGHTQENGGFTPPSSGLAGAFAFTKAFDNLGHFFDLHICLLLVNL